MTAQQKGKVAILVANGFEQIELEAPRKALTAAGFTAEIVSPESGSTVRGFHHFDKGDEFPIDVALAKAQPDDYLALLLPGGVINPDQLRQKEEVLGFVRHFFDTGKPVAAICHGPWTLIDAGVVGGRRMTSWASIKNDLRNAGAEWVDEEVVTDRGLITSRSPKDLPAFCKKIVEAFQLDPQLREAAERRKQIGKLWELIKDIRVAMLTTREPDGSLHSRPMGTQLKKFEGTLWFFTALHSPKQEEVAGDQHVSVTYADPKQHRYVSVTGRARVVPAARDRQRAEELWTPLDIYLRAWFPRGLDDPELGLMSVEVERAEFWDAPAGKVVVLYDMLRSLLTGKAWNPAESAQHETIRLDPAAGPTPASRSMPQPTQSIEPAEPAASEPAAPAAKKTARRDEKEPEPEQEPERAEVASASEEATPEASAEAPPETSSGTAKKRTRKSSPNGVNPSRAHRH
jgi:protease I